MIPRTPIPLSSTQTHSNLAAFMKAAKRETSVVVGVVRGVEDGGVGAVGEEVGGAEAVAGVGEAGSEDCGGDAIYAGFYGGGEGGGCGVCWEG